MNNTRHLLSLTLICLLLGLPSRLQAQALDLCAIPDALPLAQRQVFVAKSTVLLRKWDVFLAKKAAFTTEFNGTKEGTARAAEAARRKAELKAEADAIVDNADNYCDEITAAIDAELKAIGGRIPKTKKRLEALTPKLLGFQDAVDEWTNLAGDARAKARHTALETTAKVLLEKLSLKEQEVELDEKALRKINLIMRKRVFLDDLFAKVVTTERLVALKSDLQVINLLKGVQKILDTTSVLEAKDRGEVAEAVLKTIEVVNLNPSYALLIADGEITIDAAYGWLATKFAKDRLNQLLSLGADQFNEVKVLTTLYQNDIDHRKTLIAARPK